MAAYVEWKIVPPASGYHMVCDPMETCGRQYQLAGTIFRIATTPVNLLFYPLFVSGQLPESEAFRNVLGILIIPVWIAAGFFQWYWAVPRLLDCILRKMTLHSKKEIK